MNAGEKPMSIVLPPPIDHYVKIENSGDVETLAECFAPNAIVRDEGHTYEGLVAIKSWKTEAKKKYKHRIVLLEVTHRDGKTVLKAELTGNFPGSPVILRFSFLLERGRIVSLEIS
jgi:SnoaL-like domain